MKKYFSFLLFALFVLSTQVGAVTRTVHVFDRDNAMVGGTNLSFSCRYAALEGSDIKVPLKSISMCCYDAVLDLPGDVTTLDRAMVSWTDGESVDHYTYQLVADIDIKWDGLIRMQQDVETSEYVLIATNPTHKLKVSLSSATNGWAGNALNISNNAYFSSADYRVAVTLESGYARTVTVPVYAPNKDDMTWFSLSNPNPQHGYVVDLESGDMLTPVTPLYPATLEREMLDVTTALPKPEMTVTALNDFMAIEANWTVAKNVRINVGGEDFYYDHGNSAFIELTNPKSKPYTVSLYELNSTGYFEIYDHNVYKNVELSLPDLTVHVLLHSDLLWKPDELRLEGNSGPVTLTPDPLLGESWYKAVYPGAGKDIHTFYVRNKFSDKTNTVDFARGGDVYLDVDYGNVMKECDRNAVDHNYWVTIASPTTKGFVLAYLEAKDYSSQYFVEALDYSFNTIMSWTVYEPKIYEQVEFTGKGYIAVTPLDEYGNALVMRKLFDHNFEDYDFGISWDGVSVSADQLTYTLNWKHAGSDDPRAMDILVKQAMEVLDTIHVNCDDLTYTYTAPRGVEGSVVFQLVMYGKGEYVKYGEKTSTYTLPSQELGEVTINALVTPDNGHDFNGNVYAWVWSGSDPSTGKCVQLTSYSAQGKDWYRATVGGVTESNVNIQLLDGAITDYTDLYTVFYTGELSKVVDNEIYIGLPAAFSFKGRYIDYIDKASTTHDYRIHDFKCEASADGRTRHYTWKCDGVVRVNAYYNDVNVNFITSAGEYLMNIEGYSNYNISLESTYDDEIYDNQYDYGDILPTEAADVNVRIYIPAETGLDPAKSLQLRVDEVGQTETYVNLVREGASNWYTANVKAVSEIMFDFLIVYDKDGSDELRSYGVSGVMEDMCYEWTPYPGCAPSVPERLADCQGIDYSLPSVEVETSDMAILFNVVGGSDVEFTASLKNAIGREVAYQGYTSARNFIMMAPAPGTYTYEFIPFGPFYGITIKGSVLVSNAEKLYRVYATTDNKGSINDGWGPFNKKLTPGTKVTLEVTPNTGYIFDGWSDGNKENPRVLTVADADINLVALFREPVAHHVTVTASEGGKVNATDADYLEGTNITLYATANTGYHFQKWSDENTDNPREITVGSTDVTLQAIFAADQKYTLTVTAGENGTVADVNGEYLPGAHVTLTATGNTGYKFYRWSDGVLGNPRDFVMPAANTAITAEFVTNETPDLKEYKLTLSCGAGGSLNISDGVYTYVNGAQVNLVATPLSGYRFVEWSDGNKNATRTVVIDKDITLSAKFEKIMVKLNVKVFGGTYVVSPSKESYEMNSTVTVTVTPSSGDFLHWGTEASVGSAVAYKSATVSVKLVDELTTLVAFCGTKNSTAYSLDVLADDDVHCNVSAEVLIDDVKKLYAEVETSGVFTKDVEFRLNAAPKTGYSFSRWQDADKNKVSKNPMTFTLDKEYEWTAFVSKIVIPTYELTLTAGAGGNVNSDDANGYYHEGDEIEIIATAKSGYRFNKWSDGNKEAKRTYVMGAEDVTLKATFIKVWTLSISAGKGGTVNEDDVNGTYDDGEEVDIIATPKAGYEFVKWSDGNKQAKRTLVMDDDYELTAEFRELQEGVLEVNADANVTKQIVNGQLIIIRDGKQYNAVGAAL